MLSKSEGIELTTKRQVFQSSSDSYTSGTASTIRINVEVGDNHIDWENSYFKGRN